MHRISLLIACAAGCADSVSLTDDIDLTWDFAISGFDADLHTPYVRGAPVTLFVNGEDDPDFTGWSVTSAAPEIFRVDDCHISATSLACEGQAVGEGTAALTVRDDRGRSVGSGRAEVLVPDRVVLEAHGYLILGRDREAVVDDLRILSGGKATYHVRYFRGDRELHGNGVLSATVPPELAATPRLTFLFENREWLTIDADPAPGAHTIELFADGVPLGARTVEVVEESAIARIELEVQEERGHESGDRLVALAQSYDASGRRIFGVDYRWSSDRIDLLGDGDLLRYTYEPGSMRQVSAERAGFRGTATLQAQGGSFSVGSSNSVGCAAGGGAGGTWLAGLALAGLALRRRRSAARRP